MLEKFQIIWNCTWGDNQNGVFEFAVKEILHLPTSTAFQGLKIGILP